LVEGELAQVAQRRIPRPEVVKDNLDAKLSKLTEGCERTLGVPQHHRFGDLQLEAMRSDAGMRYRALDHLQQARALELRRRQVDRNFDVLGPGCGVLTGLP